MAHALKRLIFYTFFGFLIVPIFPAFAQDQATEPEKTPIPNITNGAPISLIIARPSEGSKTMDVDFSWFPAFALEYLIFRLDGIGQFHVVYPDTLCDQFPDYCAFGQSPPSRQSYFTQARKCNASFVLFPEIKMEKKSKALELSITLQSVDNDDKRVECKASCEKDKFNEGMDSCIAQLISAAGISVESYTAKFMRTKIVGSGKCERLVGTSVVAMNKSSNQNHAKIAEDLKKCSDQESQSYLAYYLGALEYAKAGRFESAALLMKDLIFRLGPVYPNLYPMTARFFRLAEQNENALQMIKVCEGLNLKTDPIILEKALVLEALDDWTNAEAAYQEVMTIAPGNFNALLFLMRKYNKDQKADEALKLSQIFEDKYPENGRGYLEKGKSFIILKERKNAQSALSRAAGLLPGNTEPRMLLGDLYTQAGDFNAALKQFTKVIELAPQNVDAHIKAAHAHTLMGNPKAALETLKKIAEKFYDNPVVLKEMGLAEYQTGDTASAKRDLSRFAQTGEADLNAFVVLGRIYDGLGQYRQALNMYEKALPLDDNKTMAQRRVDNEKAKLGGKAATEETNPLAGSLEGTSGSKGGSRLTIRVFSIVALAGGSIGGYILNGQMAKKIADAQQNYDNEQNPALIAARHEELAQANANKNKSVPIRNTLYALSFLGAAGFTVTFIIK